MEEMIKMKSEKRNYKLMPLLLNVLKYLLSKAKPHKYEFIKYQRIRFIFKKKKCEYYIVLYCKAFARFAFINSFKANVSVI